MKKQVSSKFLSRRDFISNPLRRCSEWSHKPMVHERQMPNTALCWLLVDVAMIMQSKKILSAKESANVFRPNGTFFLKMIRTKAKQGCASQVGQMIMTTFYTAIASLTRKTEISLNPSPMFTRKVKPAIALHCAMHSYHWSIPAEKWKEGMAGNSRS